MNEDILVDPEDRHFLEEHTWGIRSTGHGRIYVSKTSSRTQGQTPLYLHRMILGLEIGDRRQVDHINGNPLDNRRANLRLCNARQNGQNIQRVFGASRFKGVSWDITHKRWTAACWGNGKRLFKRTFRSEIEAAKAYDSAAILHFGEFACTNKDLGLLVES